MAKEAVEGALAHLKQRHPGLFPDAKERKLAQVQVYPLMHKNKLVLKFNHSNVTLCSQLINSVN